MSAWYLDTSAALKLLIEEAESDALAEAIDAAEPNLTGCWLLETELRRSVQRIPQLSHQAVSELLDGVDLYEVPASVFREAGLLPGEHLQSLDAVHLAVAVRLGVDELLTYDRRMAGAARGIGLSVLAPG